MGLETWQTVLEHTTVYSTASSWLACTLDDVSSGCVKSAAATELTV